MDLYCVSGNSPTRVYTGTATEMLVDFILRSANARLLRIEGGNPARVFFSSTLGVPECSLPITELSRYEVQRELRRVAEPAEANGND